MAAAHPSRHGSTVISTRQTIQIDPRLYAAIMRRRFVWTPQARAAVKREALRLHCASSAIAWPAARAAAAGLSKAWPMAEANGNGKITAPDADVLARSVTRDDYNTEPMAGAVYHFTVPALGSNTIPDLPGFWSFARDWVLYSTLYRESMWGAALSIAISKVTAQGFDIKGNVPLRVKRAQQLFLGFDDNKGWVSGLQKHLLSYLVTGNGAHTEIVRATRGAGSRILGLVPLNSFRCLRTGDPDVPIIYRDRKGRMHEMRDYQVFSLADMPDPMDLWYGVGHCAAERAYRAIIKLEGIERFVFEKVTGQRALAIHLVGGVGKNTINDALTTARGEAQSKGLQVYMGAAIAPINSDAPVSLVTIPLAELPEGFQRKEEWDIALTTYARAIGIPVQDLQPLSGQGLGTGAQTQVLDEAAKGQGLAAWRPSWEHNVNQHVLDDKTSFYFNTNDLRDREREATVRGAEATAVGAWVAMGAITPAQALNVAVDRDQLPKEFLLTDQTAGNVLSDDEKPGDHPADGLPAIGETVPTPISEALRGGLPVIGQTPGPGVPLISQKALDALQAGDDVELLDVARELLEAARKEEPPAAPVPDPATQQALDTLQRTVGGLAVQVKTLQQPDDRPRRYAVTKRDNQGHILEWEETPAEESAFAAE